jgi:hypothetical protein
MTGLLSEKQICPDGKKLKGYNPRSRGNLGLYIVNARVSEHRVCTGQKKVEDRSNETEAIPALLEEPRERRPHLKTIVRVEATGVTDCK